jgi:spore coat polysaccharide biosynthesis protein SpsF
MPLPTNSERTRTAVIVQARYGSTRLPGKVLKTLGGTTVLQHVLRRCKMIPSADLVICATTTGNRENAIAEIARTEGVDVFRGSETDVLSRYHGAAEAVGADIVMRVTSDCPLIDPLICDRVIELLKAKRADFTCNNMPPSWPHGLDCEAFTISALSAAHQNAVKEYDREHVTPWIRRNEGLRRLNLPREGSARHELRWTLDYPEDFDFFKAVFERYSDTDIILDTERLICALDNEPELAVINQRYAAKPNAQGEI